MLTKLAYHIGVHCGGILWKYFADMPIIINVSYEKVEWT